jgi:hypothetical protein
VVPTVPPLAPAKVLRTDTSIPTRRRSSRPSRAGASTAAAGESPQGPAEASRLRPADQPAMAEPAVAEERPAPAVVGTQAAAAAVVEVQPAEAAAAEARPVVPAAEEAERARPVAAPVDAAAQPEVVAAAPC